MRNEAELIVGGIHVTRQALVRALHALHQERRRHPELPPLGNVVFDLSRAQQEIFSGLVGLQTQVLEQLSGVRREERGAGSPPPARVVFSGALGGKSTCTLRVPHPGHGRAVVERLQIRDQDGAAQDLAEAIGAPSEVELASGEARLVLQIDRARFGAAAAGAARRYFTALVLRAGAEVVLCPLEIEVQP